MRWSLCSRFIRKLRRVRVPQKDRNRKLLCEPLECRVLLAPMHIEDEVAVAVLLQLFELRLKGDNGSRVNGTFDDHAGCVGKGVNGRNIKAQVGQVHSSNNSKA